MQLYLEHHTYYKSTAVGNLKPVWWGSPLVREKKNQEENACNNDDDDDYDYDNNDDSIGVN